LKANRRVVPLREHSISSPFQAAPSQSTHPKNYKWRMFSPEQTSETAVALADLLSDPGSFEGEVWKNAHGGCGGGAASTVAEAISDAVAEAKAALENDDAVFKTSLIALRKVNDALEDYGIDEYAGCVEALEAIVK
jgi:hypothetical protein